ncbi:MAG: phage/plasmid primase, P4 family [Casimicrobiaceae bacterium]
MEFVERYGNMYRYVPAWRRWLKWDGQRWDDDSTGRVYDVIRRLVWERVAGGLDERPTANASFVWGVERLARTDQSIVVLPEQLDSDPWLLNTPSGIVDLRTGGAREHDPLALLTKITRAAPDAAQGAELWATFLRNITLGDVELESYLRRLAGYMLTGVTTEDVIIFLFGDGANGKSSFAEALERAMGRYAKVFPSEVLMLSKVERHPTELAQFQGIRFALTSEIPVAAAWNDSRLKSLTGDAKISARVMRGDPFEFERSHKMMILGNHLPRLNDINDAIRRRMQAVPFRAAFPPGVATDVRERLKSEALCAVLAWAIQGAAEWKRLGTSPPESVRTLTDDYLAEQDDIAQWIDERCERIPTGLEQSSRLHLDYATWCKQQGVPAKSNRALSRYLAPIFGKPVPRAAGNIFVGLKLRSGGCGPSSIIDRTRARTHTYENGEPSTTSTALSDDAVERPLEEETR